MARNSSQDRASRRTTLPWTGRPIDRPDDTLNDVVDIGEVANHPALVEDRNGNALQNSLGELEQRHVRTAPRAVDGEKPQTGARQPVEVRVGMRH